MTVPGGLGATATAVLRFDASAVRPGVMEANSSLQQLYGTVRDNWWGIRNLGEVYAGIGAVITGGLAAATSAAVNFEQGTAIIFKNVADSATLVPARMKEIRQALQDLSTTTPVALDDLIKIAQQGALYGIASNQIVEFTKKVADLTIGTNLTVQDIGALKQVMNEFNLPVDQIDRLGSALFVAEKNSSANASTILTLTRQYGSLFHEIGITADQAIALAAAAKSQGAQAQSTATALINTILKIGQAQSDNIPLFENYAKVAGLTTDEFKDMLRNEPAQVFVRLASGLSDVSHNSADVAKVMDDLGIKNKRQIVAMEDLAAASVKTAGGQASLSEQLQKAAEAYNNTDAFQKEVERQSQTTARQIILLKNDFQVLAIGIGDTVLPALNFTVKVLQDVVLGFNELPQPVREGIALFGGITGGTLLFAGAMLLLLPRLAQAAAAIRNIREALLAYEATQQAAIAIVTETQGAEAAAALSSIRLGGSRRAAIMDVIKAETEMQAVIARRIELEVALEGAETTRALATDAATAADAAHAEMEGLIVELQQARVAGNSELVTSLSLQIAAARAASVAAGEEALNLAADATAAEAAAVAMAELAAAEAAETAAATGASAGAVALGAALDFATGPIGIIIISVTALAAGLSALFYWLGKNKEATDKYRDADQQLADQMARTGSDVRAAANNYLIHQDGMLQLIDTAKSLKITTADLFAAFRGDDANASASVIKKVNQAVEDGVPGAQALADALDKYNKTIVASAEASKSLVSAGKDLKLNTDGNTASTLGLGSAQNKATNAADVRAHAELALVDAERSLADANAQVRDAEQRLADARENLALRSEHILALEDAVTTSRLHEQDATDALAKAEENLKNARADAAAKLELDKLNLAKLKAQELLDTLNLQKAQDALNGAQNASDSDLASKTERLADARRILFQATKDAADAEYNLMYLKEQGATAEEVAAAQRRVRDSQNNVRQAQANVDDLGANAAKQDDPSLEAAQGAYNLAAAQEQLAANQKSIVDLTRQIADEQKAAARDQSYKNAQKDLTAAQIGLRDAQRQTESATRDLKKELSDNPEAKAYADAQKTMEDALVNRAKATVEVKKDTFELSGQTFTAQQEVDALRDALGQEAGQVTGPLHDALLGYAADLKAVGPAAKQGADEATGAINSVTTTANQRLDGVRSSHKGMLDGIFDQHGFFPGLHQSLDDIGTTIKNFGTPLKNIVDGMWGKAFGGIPGVISNLYGKLPDSVKNVFSSWGSTIGGAVAGPLSQALQTLADPINTISHFINDHIISNIDKLNKADPFGNPIPHIDKIPDINFTKHAEGGVFDRPHIGMIAEAGAEAIVPLQTFADMMRPVTLLTAQLALQQRSMDLLIQQSRTEELLRSSGAVTNSKSITINSYNPVAERDSDSLPRKLQAIDFVEG